MTVQLRKNLKLQAQERGKENLVGSHTRWLWAKSFISSLSSHHLPIFTFSFSCPANGAQFSVSPATTPKKTKVEAYKLTPQQKAEIKADRANAKLWGEALEALKDGPVNVGVN